MADTRPKDEPLPEPVDFVAYKEKNPEAVMRALQKGIARDLSKMDPDKDYTDTEVQAVPPTPFQVMIGTEDNKTASTEPLKEIMPQSFASPKSTFINHMIEGATRTTNVVDFNKFKQQKAARQQAELEKKKQPG